MISYDLMPIMFGGFEYVAQAHNMCNCIDMNFKESKLFCFAPKTNCTPVRGCTQAVPLSFGDKRRDLKEEPSHPSRPPTLTYLRPKHLMSVHRI